MYSIWFDDDVICFTPPAGGHISVATLDMVHRPMKLNLSLH